MQSWRLVESSASELRLLKNLMPSDSWNSNKVWPAYNIDGSRAKLNVTMDLTVKSIINFDVREQQLTLAVYIDLWKTTTLVWNPVDYGNQTTLAIRPDQLWVPDIIADDDISDNARDLNMYMVLLSSDGSALWSSPMVLKLMCAINLSMYPFDTKICFMTFSSYVFNSALLSLSPMTDPPQLSRYFVNNEWEIVRFSVRTYTSFYADWGTYDVVKYCLVIKRIPLYYMYNLVAPCVILVLLGLSGFLLPATSGEKMSMFMTTLLTLVMFFYMVNDTLPQQWMCVPAISIFFGGMILLLSLSCLAAVSVENVRFRGEITDTFPQWAMRILSSKCLTTFLLPSDVVKKVDLLQQRMSQNIHERTTIGSRQHLTEHNATVECGWTLLAVLLDRCFLMTFLTMTLIFLAYISFATFVKNYVSPQC